MFASSFLFVLYRSGEDCTLMALQAGTTEQSGRGTEGWAAVHKVDKVTQWEMKWLASFTRVQDETAGLSSRYKLPSLLSSVSFLQGMWKGGGRGSDAMVNGLASFVSENKKGNYSSCYTFQWNPEFQEAAANTIQSKNMLPKSIVTFWNYFCCLLKIRHQWQHLKLSFTCQPHSTESCNLYFDFVKFNFLNF